MESAEMYLDDALARIRAGKASARILDVVRVEYYGQMSPLANVAPITTPDARTIQIRATFYAVRAEHISINFQHTSLTKWSHTD